MRNYARPGGQRTTGALTKQRSSVVKPRSLIQVQPSEKTARSTKPTPKPKCRRAAMVAANVETTVYRCPTRIAQVGRVNRRFKETRGRRSVNAVGAADSRGTPKQEDPQPSKESILCSRVLTFALSPSSRHVLLFASSSIFAQDQSTNASFGTKEVYPGQRARRTVEANYFRSSD
jgi:hypothetical protein